ncbi:hypothetical protein M9H77_13235 [Catharanthus roseus]|uniref:Uncharacterized protein n=1 Tax=Catharanthus roseus TaxID=4058 RepID=A0ACC0BJM0_CATRO|nr:hypothetical protein M9H77_13235 [Catharanthus roseus]
MEYNWSNPSWKRLEVKSKQEDYQSKLARDMHNFHHGGGNAFNTYGGSNHENGNFITRRLVGVVYFSSYVKYFEHTSYDVYGGYGRDNAKCYNYEHSPYDCYEKYHHIKEEMSNMERCDFMSDKNTEKGSIENQEKERLGERLCIFDSISIISKESVHFESSKEKESELEKSERVKESEFFIEIQESKKEQKEKEIIVLEKSEKNFEDSSKDGGKLSYKSIKTINFFPSNSYLRSSMHCWSMDNKSLTGGHVLCLDEKMNMKLIKYIHSKNHDDDNTNNKKFKMR